MCTDYHCIWIISKIWSINPCLSGERCSPSSREEGMEKQSLLKHLAVLPPLSQSSRAWDVKLSQFCETGPHLKHVWNIKHLRSLAEVGESNYVSETSYMAPWAMLAWRCIGTMAVALSTRWSYMKLLAFFQCLKGLCSPQQKAWICSDFLPFEVPTTAARWWSPAAEQAGFDCWVAGTWSGQISVTPCKSTRRLSAAVFASF